MSAVRPHEVVSQERRAKALALAAAGKIPVAEREFVSTIAAVLQGFALIGQTNGSSEYADCATDAFRLRCALEDESPVAALETAAVGICAGESAAAREYLRQQQPESPRTDIAWDERVLAVLVHAWLVLLRDENAEQARRLAHMLTEEQSVREKAFFDALHDDDAKRAAAWRLVPLYHFAQATHDIATYRLDGGPAGLAAKANFHFEQALMTADVELFYLLSWLQAAAFRTDP